MCPGLREEDVVERRLVQVDLGRAQVLLVERPDHVGERAVPVESDGARTRPGRCLDAETGEDRREARSLAAGLGDDLDGRLADLRLQCGRGAFGDDPAVVDDADTVCQHVGLFEVLRRQEDGHSFIARESPDLFPERGPALRVEPGGRLVEEENRRRVDQRERKIEPALHPARVRADLAVAGRGEADAIEEPVDQFLPPGAADPVQRRLQPQVLAAGQERVEGGLLQGGSDRRPHLRAFADDVVARNRGATRRRRQQGGEHVDGGRLAGPVRAEEAVDLAGGDPQVDSVDCEHVLELPDEPLDLDSLALPRHIEEPIGTRQVGHSRYT